MIRRFGVSLPRMPRKPIELPPSISRNFVREMRLYFPEKGHKADEIAARQSGSTTLASSA